GTASVRRSRRVPPPRERGRAWPRHRRNRSRDPAGCPRAGATIGRHRKGWIRSRPELTPPAPGAGLAGSPPVVEAGGEAPGKSGLDDRPLGALPVVAHAAELEAVGVGVP